MTISPETLTWLRQSAALDGAVVSQTLLNLLERVETLERRPTCKEFLQVPPTPEAAPVATDEELLAMRSWSSHGPTLDSDLVELGRACYNFDRKHGVAQPPAAQPAQVAAPAGELVPVPVSERPWEKGGWTDLDGECWWYPPDGPAYWSMANPAMVYGGWLLPAHAIPLPQAGEVDSWLSAVATELEATNA